MSHRVVGTALRISVAACALALGVTDRSQAQGQIAIGQVMQSQLTAASPVNNEGRRYAMWSFMGNAGQPIQIDMQSTDLDSYLILQDQNGNELSRNDDGGGGLNARINFTLTYSGVYRILAMSYRTSGVMFGTYNLSLSQSMMAQPMVQPMAAAAGQIAIGQSLSGQISPMSPVNNENRRYSLWTFMGNAGQPIQIDMTSNELDSYLILQDQMGNELSRNDDGGGGLNSRINYTLTYSGAYRILAMSFRTSGVMFGTYTLSLMGGGMMAQPMAQPMVQPMVSGMVNPSGVVGTIGVGQQAQGTLSMGDAHWDGKPFQAYNFQCAAGQSFQMDILSSWDNYAMVFDPMGNVVARDDDSGEGLNARITYTCLVTGMYRLAVTVFSASTTPGPYTMQVTGMAGPSMMQPQAMQPMQPMQPMVTPVVTSAVGAIAGPGQMSTVVFGQRAQGRLEVGDRQMQDSTYADIWMFQGAAGQAITIDLMSDQFDSYLQLLDASGNRLAEDDDSGGNLNARISYTLPANAQYQIVVNNYGSSRRIGLYTLWVH